MFRDALPSDRTEFLSLWSEFLKELETYGGEYVPDRETLSDVRALFDAYTQGSLFGCCVLYEPPGAGIQGATLGGEGWGKPAIRSKAWGRTAWGWGVHIRPEYRKQAIAYHLQINIGRKLKDLGFDTLVADVLVENEAGMRSAEGIGWKPHAIVHVARLKDIHGVGDQDG